MTHIEQVRHLYCFKSRADNKYTRPYKKATEYFNNATVDVGISLDKVLTVGLDSSCLQNNTSLDYSLENSSLICIKKKKNQSQNILRKLLMQTFLSLYRKKCSFIDRELLRFETGRYWSLLTHTFETWE